MKMNWKRIKKDLRKFWNDSVDFLLFLTTFSVLFTILVTGLRLLVGGFYIEGVGLFTITIFVLESRRLIKNASKIRERSR